MSYCRCAIVACNLKYSAPGNQLQGRTRQMMGYLPVQLIVRAPQLDQTGTVPTRASQISVSAAYQDLSRCAASSVFVGDLAFRAAKVRLKVELVVHVRLCGVRALRVVKKKDAR